LISWPSNSIPDWLLGRKFESGFSGIQKEIRRNLKKFRRNLEELRRNLDIMQCFVPDAGQPPTYSNGKKAYMSVCCSRPNFNYKVPRITNIAPI
jgi:hypothetical protein